MFRFPQVNCLSSPPYGPVWRIPPHLCECQESITRHKDVLLVGAGPDRSAKGHSASSGGLFVWLLSEQTPLFLTTENGTQLSE